MFNLDIYEVTFEIYIEDKMVQRQMMSAPKEMLIINFVQTMEQIGHDKRPMKIRMYRPTTIWDNFDNVNKTLNLETSFSNNAMIAWEEKNKT